MRILLFAAILILSSQASFGQLTTRITVNYGGSVYFHVNSMNKYQNGISYTNYTQLELYYKHDDGGGNPVGSDWELLVKANSPNIIGDGGNVLSLSQVEITTEIGASSFGPFPLSSADTRIAWGTQTVLEERIIVNISYSCGLPPPGLLGESPDYYFVDLEFTLQEDI